MRLSVCCPSVGGHEKAMKGWIKLAVTEPPVVALTDTEGKQAGFLSKLQHFWECEPNEVLCYLHSDLTIHSKGWDAQILAEFEDPSVAVVGFVGALELGHRDIYKIPYDYRQLARADVWSNLTDWSSHGQQLTAPCSVAVVDSCAVAVRKSLLDHVGGWPVGALPNSSHCSDLWICLEAARAGMKTRIIPVSCSHSGGGKGEVGSQWLEERGGDTKLHRDAHWVTYDSFRDILPLVVQP